MSEGDQLKQVIVRAPEESHQRWKDAAARRGLSMSEFVRQAADAEAAQVLDCPHDRVQEYPWSAVCLRCGQRLRG